MEVLPPPQPLPSLRGTDTLAHNEFGDRFQARIHRDDRHRSECDDTGIFANGHARTQPTTRTARRIFDDYFFVHSEFFTSFVFPIFVVCPQFPTLLLPTIVHSCHTELVLQP